ncbi:zinc finger protein 654-like [Boleophthalmus pectinirostris]|uniref:zinc finger protein 654-like n=1 Tax=Boleophthalmus pectinirostris TaxID=150288 RepID=UPI00242EF968|nr:zinc finger protein 654-like [Boleophthalmus pectinirostris]
MAEQGTVYDLKRLEQQLQTLFSRFTYNDLQADSKPFCSSFCKLVEYYASRWKVPLPQLRILERALCCFTQASVFFTVNCDHVLHTLSSLALSIFELLLFFDQRDFDQDPLKKITVTFQECCSALVKYQNVHLLQVERLLRAGGPWASPTLHAILSESTLPQTEVEDCISSEPPIFFELRVRYLLSCQRLPEAQALAKCCAQHPSVGQHLFFYQVYLTGLYKTSQHECLLEELVDFSGKDAVNFLCSLESEENDELLLDFSRAFLSLQLCRGDMHFLCDLVSIWGRLHRRLKTSKEFLLEECEQLILSATNVNAIFPFIRVIIHELSEEGVQFCVELCANALRSCLPCDVITKSLIYKTMASLVPNDLEICRACALLVFFLERSVEAYKMVYILYMHPDQEYHVDCCPIGNRVRFETLQTLKKDLYFDPEFWNLIALRTNCLKLMNEKVLSAALVEIMEEKWVPSYCRKENSSSSSRSKSTKENAMAKKKKLHKGDQQKDGKDKAPAKKVGRPRLNKHLPLKKKGNQGTKQWKDTSSEPMRRSSFWQLDRLHHNRALDYWENRRTTRLSERVPAKRMIRTPKWLLEDSGTLDKNAPLLRRTVPKFTILTSQKEECGSQEQHKTESEIRIGK